MQRITLAACATAFKDVWDTNGRMGRTEFGWLFFGTLGVTVLLRVAPFDLRLAPALEPLVAITYMAWVLFQTGVAVCAGIKRFHDIGLSGRPAALMAVPLVNLALSAYLLSKKGLPEGATAWG